MELLKYRIHVHVYNCCRLSHLRDRKGTWTQYIHFPSCWRNTTRALVMFIQKPTLYIPQFLFFTPQPLRLEGIVIDRAGDIQNLVNTITLCRLPVSCCNFTWMFSTYKSWTSSTLTFVWPFWTFKLAQGQAALTLQELPLSFRNFTEIFSTSKSQRSLMLTFVQPFELVHVQIATSCRYLWIW